MCFWIQYSNLDENKDKIVILINIMELLQAGTIVRKLFEIKICNTHRE